MPGLSNGWEWLHFALLPFISPEMSPLGKVYHPLVGKVYTPLLGNQDQVGVGVLWIGKRPKSERVKTLQKKHQGEIHQEKIRVIDQRIMAQFKAPQTKD